MANRKMLLMKLLEPLIDEWGVDEVRSILEHLASDQNRLSSPQPEKDRKLSRPSTRFTALDLVKREQIQEDKKRPLVFLAEMFDRKEFLPSVADVRQFIIMSGERPTSMKDRVEAFRTLLKILIGLPSERLEKIAEAAANSGPAQLGPISDAIAAAGERLPRHRERLEA